MSEFPEIWRGQRCDRRYRRNFTVKRHFPVLSSFRKPTRGQIQLPNRSNPRTFDHELENPEKRAEFIKMLESLLSNHDQGQRPEELHQDLAKCDFLYDIKVQASNGTELRRRMTLKFNADVNIMSEDVQRRLGAKIQPYYGPPISIPEHPNLRSLGTVNVLWSFCQRNKPYRSDFHVVPNMEYDFLMGRPSMREQELYQDDLEIARRLLVSYQNEEDTFGC
ncbi:hypothetical protein AbraIFM66951_001320 [Aspergillus brasiliensis]|uniref:Uncharacterized protein n=1 Tax=Aspergillus brasiliensis TaxID=319629 RepID=A0A9W5YUU8_9EURO|nr:hypothetical protein AbraCBS73388_011196 [Aspergillus brasiliensis]GKZ49065.1 hypothetical protein AbraIFM66951_001320 [Aspergillus brasiliensis]